jgi:hypothetical protein
VTPTGTVAPSAPPVDAGKSTSGAPADGGKPSGPGAPEETSDPGRGDQSGDQSGG